MLVSMPVRVVAQATRCCVVEWCPPRVISSEFYAVFRRTSEGEWSKKIQKISPGVLVIGTNRSDRNRQVSVPLLLTVVAPLPPAVRAKPVTQAGSPRNRHRTAMHVLGCSAARVCGMSISGLCTAAAAVAAISSLFQAAETMHLVPASD